MPMMSSRRSQLGVKQAQLVFRYRSARAVIISSRSVMSSGTSSLKNRVPVQDSSPTTTAPGGLDDVVQLPVGNGHGRAGDEDALGALGEDADAVFHPLFKFLVQSLHDLGLALDIVVHRDLGRQERVLAGDRRRDRRPEAATGA